MDRRMTFLPFFLALLQLKAAQLDRVLLRDVQELTLHRDAHTTGVRSVPMPQLLRVGGTAQGLFAPNVVQCYNRASDGVGVQWECKALLPAKFRFGKISVSCEGYDYPGDPYILAGSCGLKYELDYSRQEAGKRADHSPSSRHKYGVTDFMCLFLILAAVAIFRRLLTWMSDTVDRRRLPHTPTAQQQRDTEDFDDFAGSAASFSSSDDDDSPETSTYEGSTGFGGTEWR
ncbi:hypothetical protein AAVH_06330 [Aphelenchoides avenae]|nr:hypothetical protein AAVH_06330 [Aphelenchus avenae]